MSIVLDLICLGSISGLRGIVSGFKAWGETHYDFVDWAFFLFNKFLLKKKKKNMAINNYYKLYYNT